MQRLDNTVNDFVFFGLLLVLLARRVQPVDQAADLARFLQLRAHASPIEPQLEVFELRVCFAEARLLNHFVFAKVSSKP